MCVFVSVYFVGASFIFLIYFVNTLVVIFFFLRLFLGARAPSAVHVGAYLLNRHTTEPSLKPVVRSVRLSAENDTVFTPPPRYEWHCSSMCCSWRWKKQRERKPHAGGAECEYLKDAASTTIADVSRMRTRPSRPTEDSHML